MTSQCLPCKEAPTATAPAGLLAVTLFRFLGFEVSGFWGFGVGGCGLEVQGSLLVVSQSNKE